MKVRCISTVVTPEHIAQYGGNRWGGDYKGFITPGTEYLVLGLSHVVNSESNGTTTWVEISHNGYYVMMFPLVLFQITDPRASEHWILGHGGEPHPLPEKTNKYTLTLWPQEFYADYFHDRLSDDKPGYLEVFQNVYNKLDKEFQ